MVKVLLATLSIVACAVLPAPARAAVSPGTYAIAGDVSEGIHNMRNGPGQHHSLVVSIPAGASGVVIGECRKPDDGKSRYDWCRATWQGHSGWVSSCCLVASRGDAPAKAARSPAPSKPFDRSVYVMVCNALGNVQSINHCGQYAGPDRDKCERHFGLEQEMCYASCRSCGGYACLRTCYDKSDKATAYYLDEIDWFE